MDGWRQDLIDFAMEEFAEENEIRFMNSRPFQRGILGS